MKAKCIAEIEAALGRKASDAEIAKIEGALRGAMKKVYLDNPSAAKAMKPHEIYAKAVKQAANDLINKAVDAKLRTASNALKMARKQAELQEVKPLQQIGQLLKMLVDKAALDRSGSQSIESRQKAIAAGAWSKLPTLQTLLVDNKKLSGSVLSEIFGERTGDSGAAKAAKEFKALNNELIITARHAGMPITPLDNWNMPQGLSSIKVAGDFERAIGDLINHVDPNIYRHENGELYTPEELRQFMTEAATTLATDGANKDSAGFRTGSGHSYQKERQIHYKDAASWRYMQDKYGDKTAGQLISQHINALSRDIALTENFGSDYRGGFKELLRQATLTARMAAKDDKARIDVDAQAAVAQRYFDNLVGDAGHTTAQGAAWARRFDIARNMITFSTMGGAGINSFPDMAGFSMIAKLSNIPEIKLWSKTMRNFLLPQNKADVDLADRIGLGMQTMLAEVQRNIRDDPLLNFSAKAANFTVVGGLLTRFERSKAMAVANVMHDAIGALTRNYEWSTLPTGDHRIFEANGVDEHTFRIWKAAGIERGQDGKNTILLPQHVYDIPNDKLDPLIQGKIDQVTEANKTVIDQLEQRSAVERTWMDSRKQQLVEYHGKLSDMLAKYMETRGKKIDTQTETTAAQVELIKASISRVETEADIASYLSAQHTQDKVGDFLWNIAKGDNFEGIQGKANRQIQALSRKRSTIGEDLGERRAKAEQRLKNAQKRLQTVHEAAGQEVDTKTAELQKRFSTKLSELQQFHSEFDNRISKRQEIIDTWQKVAGEAVDKLRDETRRDAALKLSGVVGRETRLASGSPGVQRRVDLNMDAARTGLTSEIQRSITFLKATPMSIVHNYWERAASSSNSKAGAMAMRARYLATSAVLGVMIYNLKSLFNGQDMFNPFDTEQDHYWTKITKSVLTGGGMGIYGDLLLQDYSGAHSTTAFSGILGGPIIGTADDLGQIFADVKRQTADGEGDLGGDTIRFIKRHAVPNFFYTKALLDHAFFQQAQEYFSPGYNHRANRRLEKGSGTQAWWPAGETMPERAPAFSK